MGNPRTAAGPQAPVREVMASVTIEVGLTDTLAAVAELMAENEVGALPIVSGGRLDGIVTERDLVRAMAEGVDPEEERASDRMTMQIEAVPSDTPIEVATDRMLEGGIRHLPVVDGSKLVGMISIRDLLTAYATFTQD
jgi:CBS domain-containing protein